MYWSKLISGLLISCFLFNISFGDKEEGFDSSDSSQNVCGNSGYVFVATIDGNLTALDFDSGRKCWSIVLDSKKFMSSSLSKLEVWENGTRIWLVPSLDGLLFKYDKLKLEPLPFNVESLLSHSVVLDQSTSVTGGKFKIVYGFHRHTGEMHYKCLLDGCENFKPISAKDALIVEQWVQSVNAIDTETAELRWHFRVVEIKIKTVVDSSSKNTSQYAHNANFENNALVPINSFKDLSPTNSLKISLVNGYTARFNQSTFDFTWLYKTSAPLVDVWFVKDKSVILLDPFSDSVEFFSIDSDDGKHTAFLFLGSYLNQLYVKQSKKLKTKVVYNHAVSRHTPYKAFCLPLNSITSFPAPSLVNDSNALMTSDVNIKDHGFYYYINFSVYDNDTHCIVNFTFPKRVDTYSDLSHWLKTIALTTLAIMVFIFSIVYYFIFRKVLVKKEFANEGTSTMELVPVTVEEVEVADKKTEVKPDFISRFHKDFQLIAILGKGGFGVVMEVKNTIDDCEYAVKRIRIGTKKYKKVGYSSVMREVKALAKLDHPGIVRYFNSWVENPPKGWQDLKDKEMDIIDVTRSTRTHTTHEIESRVPTKSDDQCKNEAAVRISEKLLVNPLNPFGDNLFDPELSRKFINESKASKKSSHGSWAGDNYPMKEDSGTLNESSKKSVSEVSYCYDYSDDFEDTETESGVLFVPKKHTGKKRIEESKAQSDIGFLKDSAAGYKVSDIRKLFNIPVDSFIDENTVFMHLQKINSFLALRMSSKLLDKFYCYFFFDISCPDPLEWSKWVCILKDIEISKIKSSLVDLQKWLISVLCVLRFSESYYHNVLQCNLSNILWQVNLVLEDDVCGNSVECSPRESTCRIGAFFHLVNINTTMAWPLKFIYLFKLRHYLFCERNQCADADWKSIFYQADISIFKKNLYLFRIWIISITCYIGSELSILDVDVSNLSRILSEVIDLLQDESIKPVSSKRFFCKFGNLLNHSKDMIQLEDNKGALLNMFHNTHSTKERRSQNSESDAPEFLYIQMQLCRRESLRNWLDVHSESRNYHEVMRMFCQIVEAMNYVHTKGLMHRDLKPSNIYFSLEGLMKIGDFGLATQFEVQEAGEDSSSSDSLYYHTRDCGTDLYMSPEQRSKKNYNFKTDMFPLGIILYELLVPFQTRSERYKAIYAVRDRKFSSDFVAKYQNECSLVQKLLDVEPKRRPTASEIMKHPLCQPYLKATKM